VPNHFHFLIYADDKACVMVKQGGLEIEILTNGIRKLLSSYARIFNKRYNQTGSLFRQKTKAKNIGEEEMVVTNKYTFQDYCSNCFLNIHQNPVAAGLVKVPGDWQFSSYLDYAGLRNGSYAIKHWLKNTVPITVKILLLKRMSIHPNTFRCLCTINLSVLVYLVEYY
jgi:putative transposase